MTVASGMVLLFHTSHHGGCNLTFMLDIYYALQHRSFHVTTSYKRSIQAKAASLSS